MEAGCKKKEWKYKDNVAVKYHWNYTGQLLATGVCVRDDYQKHFPPEDGTTKVYSTIAKHEVRQVDAKKMTLSLDFILTMQWLDSRIYTNLPNEKSKGGGITLGPTAIEQIWSPDLRILNRQSFKAKDEWASLITTRILTGTDIYHLEGTKNTNHARSVPTVEMKYDVKTTVYCKGWSYRKYPMDDQTCKVAFGSASASSIFILHQESASHNNTDDHRAANFDMKIEYFDKNETDGSNQVGIKITMDRVTTSFILKYYVPCIAIVLVSEIGFIIPVTAIPGRVGLLVTQFLTLINLFIHQMVRTFNNRCLCNYIQTIKEPFFL